VFHYLRCSRSTSIIYLPAGNIVIAVLGMMIMILVPILLYIPCPQGPFDDLAHKIYQPRHYNCRYQARKMSGHLFMLWGIDSASDFSIGF
jgi:hypothetical protein